MAFEVIKGDINDFFWPVYSDTLILMNMAANKKATISNEEKV